MIIFDLDGTLADCEHRRHFVKKTHCYACGNNKAFAEMVGCNCHEIEFKPNWQAFYEACDKDEPINETIEILINCLLSGREVQIWSGRSESVREKTMNWLQKNLFSSHRLFYNSLHPEPKLKVKMRPEFDYTPDDVLKECWLDEAIANGKKVEYVFDDRPKVVRMWRLRGIFVFDCNQTGEEF